MPEPRIVTLSGSYYEQGRQHGAALADVIAEITGEIIGKLDWQTPKVEAALARLRTNTERHAPALLEELRGIADGSGQPEAALWAYNCVADIWQVNAFCTNVAFRRTPDGPAIGKTNDIGQHAQKYHALFRRTSGAGVPMLWATWPGTLWANCFVTASGLAFGGASVVKRVRNEAGIPSNILLRWIGEAASSVEEAIDVLRETPIMHHPANITLADSDGRLVVVEKAPDGCEVRECGEEGALFATNHFCTPGLRGTDNPGEDLGPNSRARWENLARLTTNDQRPTTNDQRPTTVARLQEILADHHQPGAICQHGHNGMWTSVAYVAVPARRTLYFAYGRPCETPFVEYRL
jgi:hypothetical protein